MILTDSHTHIYYKTGHELDEQVQRALQNNVTRLFLPNVNVRSIPMVFGLQQKYPDHCFPMLGLHPCDVKLQADEDTLSYRDELDQIHREIGKRKIYAIGEIGIDLYWDKSTLDIQVEAFEVQINWAKTLNLPIVIHCREAFDEVYSILLRQKDDKLRGILHCFTGTTEQARKIIDLGFYLGIGGVVTYKNSGLDKVVADIPAEHIVLETDAPYLTPVPYRGKPNESSYLIHIAQKVADIKQVSIEKLAEITTENSKKIFCV
ncbi:TatD family deoxyribonuclease (plasmid) [Pedobacter sp. BS3]|uniref:TatD family hydrolase n=1 Tax=Pedobacter sp. BS3 TaxID=2567937 RepID=UPI0011F00533|nr:TatD family hydrolase [Pedobacter sp. BS3]TZF85975.1 TatD family deoxyribonuclease [Pedobacter sp. BS3]